MVEYKETGNPYYPDGGTERDIDGPEKQNDECSWIQTVFMSGWWSTDCAKQERYLGVECDPFDFQVCPYCSKKLVKRKRKNF